MGKLHFPWFYSILNCFFQRSFWPLLPQTKQSNRWYHETFSKKERWKELGSRLRSFASQWDLGRFEFPHSFMLLNSKKQKKEPRKRDDRKVKLLENLLLWDLEKEKEERKVKSVENLCSAIFKKLVNSFISWGLAMPPVNGGRLQMQENSVFIRKNCFSWAWASSLSAHV